MPRSRGCGRSSAPAAPGGMAGVPSLRHASSGWLPSVGSVQARPSRRVTSSRSIPPEPQRRDGVVVVDLGAVDGPPGPVDVALEVRDHEVHVQLRLTGSRRVVHDGGGHGALGVDPGAVGVAAGAGRRARLVQRGDQRVARRVERRSDLSALFGPADGVQRRQALRHRGAGPQCRDLALLRGDDLGLLGAPIDGGPWARTEQGRRYAGNPQTSRYGPRGREQTGPGGPLPLRAACGATDHEMSGDVTLRSARSRADGLRRPAVPQRRLRGSGQRDEWRRRLTIRAVASRRVHAGLVETARRTRTHTVGSARSRASGLEYSRVVQKKAPRKGL